MDVSKLEPADRDPKKLRSTAIKIVIFMICSGIFLQYSYTQYRKRTADSDRPSLETKITETEVELLTADGRMRNFQDLKGKITLALTLSKEIQAESLPTLEAVREVMEAFKDAPEKPVILAFVLDGSNTEPGEMKAVLSEFGEEPDVWRVAANDSSKSSLRSFTKTKLRFNRMPTEKDGVFDYDTRLVLLDQFLHVRGLPDTNDGWDFGTVVEMEKQFEAAQKEHPDEELRPLPMTTAKLRETLITSIKYLYANPNEKAQK
ncbi:hypothetical protein V2O64_02965 [Verrucomicrobiaceae bacterium 227]